MILQGNKVYIVESFEKGMEQKNTGEKNAFGY